LFFLLKSLKSLVDHVFFIMYSWYEKVKFK
jgi:hypothetical protein